MYLFWLGWNVIKNIVCFTHRSIGFLFWNSFSTIYKAARRSARWIWEFDMTTISHIPQNWRNMSAASDNTTTSSATTISKKNPNNYFLLFFKIKFIRNSRLESFFLNMLDDQTDLVVVNYYFLLRIIKFWGRKQVA